MKKGLILAMALGIALLTPLTSKAASDCDFKKGLNEFQAVKGDEEKELAARKELLSSVIQCLIRGSEKAKNNIDSLPSSKGDNLKTRFSQELKGDIVFYQGKLDELQSADLGTTKDLAKDISRWKKEHADEMERASYFVVWVRNQSMLETARKRLAQLSSLLSFKPNSSLQNTLEKADFYLKDALDDNSVAQESFERYVPPKDSMAYIKSSLDSMYKAYKNFLQISAKTN